MVVGEYLMSEYQSVLYDKAMPYLHAALTQGSNPHITASESSRPTIHVHPMMSQCSHVNSDIVTYWVLNVVKYVNLTIQDFSF